MGTRILELWGDKHQVTVVDKAADPEALGFIKTDLTNMEEVAAAMYDVRPDWVIHMAAFTDVEKAESDQDLAFQVNVTATENLVNAVRDQGSRMLYFSTGFVYEGNKDSYLEDDDTKPINYYGVTKLNGENIVRDSGVPYCIIRPNYPYRTKWEQRSDTVRWMISKLQNNEKINLVADQKISPTFIDDLSVVLDKIISKNITGIFNTAGPDCLSFYEIGLQVAEVFGFDKELLSSITLDKYLNESGKKASQPKISCLSSKRIENLLGIKMTSFSKGLNKVKESYS